MSTSELAQLRTQIEQECQALHHLMQFSEVASHRAINGRYRNLERYSQQLTTLVTEEQAVDILVDIYKRWMK